MANGATEFLPAANEFNSGLGETVGQFAVSLVEADMMAQQARMRSIEEMVVDPETGEARAPLDFRTQINGNDGEPLIGTDISVPLIAIAEGSYFMPETATLTMDMEVNSHAEDRSSLEAEGSAEGEGKLGWGPFSASVKISAKTSVSKESKRSSDYTSKTHAELKMARIEPPEGLAIVIDAINRTVKAGIELQLAKTNDEIQRAAAALKVLPDSGPDDN